jgi:hypothetical protein
MLDLCGVQTRKRSPAAWARQSKAMKRHASFLKLDLQKQKQNGTVLMDRA